VNDSKKRAHVSKRTFEGTVAAPVRVWRELRQSPTSQRKLYYGRSNTSSFSLGARVVSIALLLIIVISVFWLDRDGLRDNIDGVISFSDVIYFAMITITTVGYGDIVPVSDSARMIDAFFVTPIRLFVWGVFLGTTYQLVARRLIEDFRMRIRQASLSGHTVICGFGLSGHSAVTELIRRGTEPQRIVVVDAAEEPLLEAAEMGVVGLRGDATREAVLRDANIGKAATAFVCLGRDDTTALTTLTIRGMAPEVRIVATVKDTENESLVQKGGAEATICPSAVSGVLMANSVSTSHVATYVYDMLTIDGRVMLAERSALPADIGRKATEIDNGLVLRIHRGDRVIGFWEKEAVIAAGDQLIVLAPRPGLLRD
jgi:voltage-gated potassium channel